MVALHIRNDRTDKLVRELASHKGVDLTEAVREAVENELACEERKIPLRERLKPLLDELDARPRLGFVPDKAFYDSLYDDED